MAVAVSDDFGNNGGSRWLTTVDDDVGDDMGDDVGNRNNAGNNAGDNANKGDGGDAGREGG